MARGTRGQRVARRISPAPQKLEVRDHRLPKLLDERPRGSIVRGRFENAHDLRLSPDLPAVTTRMWRI